MTDSETPIRRLARETWKKIAPHESHDDDGCIRCSEDRSIIEAALLQVQRETILMCADLAAKQAQFHMWSDSECAGCKMAGDIAHALHAQAETARRAGEGAP